MGYALGSCQRVVEDGLTELGRLLLIYRTGSVIGVVMVGGLQDLEVRFVSGAMIGCGVIALWFPQAGADAAGGL